MGVFSGAPLRGQPVQERATWRVPPAPSYATGSDVPVVNADTAKQSVAIRTTTDIIASLASELPIVVTDQNDKVKPTPGNLADPAGDGTGLEDWGYRLTNSWLYTGNCFADVLDEDANGMIRQAELVNRVTATIDQGKITWYVNGREVARPDMFRHWRVNPVTGALFGLSPIEAHAVSIGVTLATTRFGREFFTDGAHPAGLLVNDKDLADVDADAAKRRIMASRGSREPIAIGDGWTWTETQINPEESQFLQTQSYSEAQCCRIFGPGFAELLGYDSGSKSNITYANIVDRRQDILVLSMNRWLRRYERVLRKFVPAGWKVNVNREAMLEPTTIQRYEAHKKSLAWSSVNEIRDIEGKPRIAAAWADIPGGTPPPSLAN